MKVISRLVVFTALLLLVNVTIRLVLASNLRNGVYPINADSIGIPLAETAMLSAVGAILLVVLVALSSPSWLFRKATSSRPWLYAVVSVLSFAYILTAVFFWLWGLSWFEPHHYLIVASCALVVGVILYFAVVDFHSLRPNNSFKPKPLRNSA